MAPSRTLVLLRHAEAGASADGADFTRPLTARGLAQAQATAAWLVETAAAPEHVWCSSAERTRATLAASASFVGDAPVDYDDALYAAGLPALLAGVQRFDDDVTSALVVFHNPAVAQAAAVLEPGPVGAYGVPPATAVVVRFDGPWAALCAEVVHDFVVREGS